jgi:hypothetical protein
VNVIPFPKPEKRQRLASRPWKRLRDKVVVGQPCASRACFLPATDAHHVYGRDLGGDDVEREPRPPLPPVPHDLRGPRARDGKRSPPASGLRPPPHGHLLYLMKKLGGPDQARSFLDRYYPERPTREGGTYDDAA